MTLLLTAAANKKGIGPSPDYVPSGVIEWWDFSYEQNVPKTSGNVSGPVIGRANGNALAVTGVIPVDTVNGRQVVAGGVDTARLSWATTTIQQPCTVMFVYKGLFVGSLHDSYSPGGFPIQSRVLSGNVVASAGVTVTAQPVDGDLHVAWFEFNTTNSRFYIDDVLVATGNVGTNPFNGGLSLLNNRNQTTPTDALLGEFMIIAGIPPSVERAATVSSRLSKWEGSDPPIDPPAEALSAPRNPVANPSSSTTASLSWTAPLSDGGTAITGYQVERSVNQTVWSNIGNPTGLTLNATGLTPDTTYYFRIRADNGSLGPWSDVVSATPSGTTAPVVLADLTGIHCLLNSGENHAVTFGQYCTTFGFVLNSVLLSLDKNGPGIASGNTAACKGYWDAWISANPTIKPNYFDVIMPLGFKNTGRTTQNELNFVLGGGYDGSYSTMFSNLKDISDHDIQMAIRIGNESNLINLPWGMLSLPEAARDLYGQAFDYVAQIGKSIIPNMLAMYNPNHTGVLTVDEYVNWANVNAPAYHNGDTTIIYDWPLNRPAGMTEVDVYGIDLYMGSNTASVLADALAYVETLAVRDNKLMYVPEWGMPDNKGTSLANAVGELQTMCDAFRAVADNRLLSHQYFDDQEPWRLSTWKNTNLMDDYISIIQND